MYRDVEKDDPNREIHYLEFDGEKYFDNKD